MEKQNPNYYCVLTERTENKAFAKAERSDVTRRCLSGLINREVTMYRSAVLGCAQHVFLLILVLS